MKLSLLVLTVLWLTHAYAAKDKICSRVIVHGTNDLDLSETEKRLVCGDKKVVAYQDIPPYQASYSMTGFLQARSYLQPRFETVGEVLHVYIGKKARLKKIRIIYANDKGRRFIRQELKRLYLKKELNPVLISTIEAGALSLLRQRGAACAKVESFVDAQNNIMTLTFHRTKVFDFGVINRQEIKDLHPNALNRYYPFKYHHRFNERLLSLTEKRMMRTEVVQGTYFTESCTDEGESFALGQRFIVGPPRTLRFGVGASTELGPMARVRWSHNRSGSMASLISGQLQGSLRSQSLKLSADTFVWKDKPRRSVLSQMEITRESQVDFEQLLFKFTPVSLKWTADYADHHWTWTIGPGLESGTYHTNADTNTKSFTTGVLEGSWHMMEHLYETFDTHPQDGDELRFNFGLRHPSVGARDPSLKLDASYVKLERLANWGRGTVVGGMRINAATTWVSDTVSAESLSPNIKFFGGGSDDLRGFYLNTLPRNKGAGALSKLILKLEARRTYLFNPNVEGFVFSDQGYFGDESFSILPQLFYSPGLGVRWHSPIGMVQGYIARALTLAPARDAGNLYYLGLGGSF